MRCVLLTAAAFAALANAPAAGETLQDALRTAYETSPTIASERARFRATKEVKSQAIAGALPQVTAGSSYIKSDSDQTFDASIFDPTLPSPTPAPNSVQLSTLAAQVQGELPLFNGFRNVNAIRQANARIEAGGAQLAAVEQDVLLRTATAYFDVVRDIRVYEATKNNVDVLLRQQDEANLRFEVGEVTRTDVAQAEARLAGARAQLTAAQAELAVSRALLAEFTGSPPGELEQDPALPPAPDSLDAALRLARVYAPRVIAARAAEEASRRQVAIAKSAFSPEISATASYQYAEEPSSFVIDDETFSYGVRASVPVFLGGLNLSRVREARALNDADRRNIDAALRRVEAETVAAWERLSAARATIESATKQRDANRLALDGVRRESQLGARTTLDVLNAEQEFLNAEVGLANATRDARAATFTLLAAAGVLTADIDVSAEAAAR